MLALYLSSRAAESYPEDTELNEGSPCRSLLSYRVWQRSAPISLLLSEKVDFKFQKEFERRMRRQTLGIAKLIMFGNAKLITLNSLNGE